jgi:hypothetical protein
MGEVAAAISSNSGRYIRAEVVGTYFLSRFKTSTAGTACKAIARELREVAMPVSHPNAESFIKLRKLSDRHDEPVADILERAMKERPGVPIKAILQLRIHYDAPGKLRDVFNIAINSNGGRFQKSGLGEPTLTAVLAEADFRRIVEGSYSPLQAYLDGKLYVRGDSRLGSGLLKHFSGGSGTQSNVCPILLNESWQSDGFTGTLTLSGEFFTPNGTVEIIYNYGSGQYQQITTADSSGKFTISQSALYCGPIPGDGNIGVIVTADDLSSGLSTTHSYATPC